MRLGIVISQASHEAYENKKPLNTRSRIVTAEVTRGLGRAVNIMFRSLVLGEEWLATTGHLITSGRCSALGNIPRIRTRFDFRGTRRRLSSAMT